METEYINAIDVLDFTMAQIMSARREGDETVLALRGVKTPDRTDGASATAVFRDLRIEGYLADTDGANRLSLAGDEASERLRAALARPVTVFTLYGFTRAERYYLTADITAPEGIVTVDASFESVRITVD